MMCSPFSESVLRKWSGAGSTWMISEKYDGWRMYYVNGKFYTRAGNEVTPPDAIVTEMKRIDPDEAMTVDGELWLGYNRFNDVGYAIAAKDPTLVWKIFDVPSLGGQYQDRYAKMCTIFGASADQRIEVVEQTSVSSFEEIKKIFDNTMAVADKEGIVIRPTDMKYEWGQRLATFMKWKRVQDLEAQVIDYYVTPAARATKDPEYISSIVCAIEAGTFRVSVKTTTPPPVGSIVCITYQNLTPNGIPRFPVLKGLRDTKDMPKSVKPPSSLSKPPYGLKILDTKEVQDKKATVKPGEKIYISGSKENSYYTITMPRTVGALPYCSCPAWKYQKKKPSQRVCKHTQLLL